MTDEELMLAVCDGDQSAYQIIVKQQLKSISHYAYRMLGNQKDTEDITQETFLKLWINAGKWQPEKSKLSTWLHRITHNLCIDYLRKHSRMQTQENIENEVDAALIEKEGADRDDATQQQTTQLEQAIGRLPENQRSALMLCYYSGFSNKEAAAIMNISVKALESSIARAKRSLRTELSESDNAQ
jgi:RNA polymerase sigma-70 factor (ECF subfamily)